MPLKHALVVDDSRSAQVALKTLLEQHDIAVDLAGSGEEALDYLQHRTVDVIFMDHTMPGMDGLEAVAAIKRNPLTATIPVMMYTTKEGEVYVGQARALGAIGVLPKEVQPHVLFDMLVKLGLVRERRVANGEAAPTGDVPQRRATDRPNEPSAAPGFALESLVRRILQDQDAFWADLRRNQRELAKQVAADVVAMQRAEQPSPPSLPERRTNLLWPGLAAATAIAACIFAGLYWEGRSTGQELRAHTASAVSEATLGELRELKTALHTARTHARGQYLKLIDVLQWAMNRSASSAWDQVAFDDGRAAELSELLTHLVAIGFRGTVRMESHLGEFCLVSDESGDYRLPAADLPIEACTHVGHPLDASSQLSERQSAGFAEFLATSPLANGSGIEVELVAYDRSQSLARQPFPTDIGRAGDWNRIAEANNRIEFSLIARDAE